MANPYGLLGARKIEGPVHRIVASRFPPVTLFDVARNSEEMELLAALEGMTNERLRNELGQLNLVSAGDGVFGPGCTPIMAAFCHPWPSRFTDGSFGIYYAALESSTAVLETAFHCERALRSASMPPEILDMRRHVGQLVEPMTLLPTAGRDGLLESDPERYAAARAFGAAMRRRNVWGIYYESVRDRPDGRCVAVLRPRAIAPVSQGAHYRYHWNGNTIERVEEIEQYTIER